MELVLLGPPGSGKGTQAKRLADAFGIPHISTGDIFRKNLAEGTELGQLAKRYMDEGTLVPDDVTERMVSARLSEPDAKPGFILDGFPRNLNQAEHFQTALRTMGRQLTCVVYLTVNHDVLMARLTGRRVCPGCGATYNVVFQPPKQAGICDVCGAELVQRPDDSEATVSRRLEVYREETAPLVAYYEKLGLLARFDGEQPVDEVTRAIQERLS
ncbi:adenylate kinase [Sulfobacillus harzensis]|uniref:Adenylate kinase n=1 Tax=Sulfobacillus harzensis TaxID=2729629 RepID=A0A7Y0L520_9FIRM|nr:adenylate kinase [Sulfobacillus harzensis]NMP21999.1 adenylate kinase [Sulfobacillus harzensis]